MNEYVTEGWPLGPTSTVYMNGKAVYHIRQYGRQGILASVELHQREAEVIRQVVEERICAVSEEARAAELEAAAGALDVPEVPDRAYYSSGYRKAMSEAQKVLRARAAAIRAGEA